jgi:F0F1-type ATP synthase assembly protein I
MSRWVAALRLTGVGFYIGGCILLGPVGGNWLDGKLNTRPVFLLVGLVLGIILAVFGVYQMLRPLLDNQSGKEND